MILGLCGAMFIGVSLGLFGSGGSIITLPVLIYLFGFDPKTAIAASLGVVSIISLFGASRAYLAKQVDLRVVASLAIPGAIGAWVGAYIAQYLHSDVQLGGFVVMVLIAAYRMYRSGQKPPKARKTRAMWLVTLVGFLMGMVTGIIGVGGGFIVVPVLVLLIRLPMVQAVGTSLSIVFINSLVGFLGHLLHEQHAELAQNYPLILLIAGMGVIGSLLGSKMLKRFKPSHLRKGFAVFLVVMAAVIVRNIV